MNESGVGLAAGLRIGVVVPSREAFLQSLPAAGLVDFAARAEDLGFESVWVGDSLTARPRLEPLALLAAIATRTRRVALGTAALTASLRPTALAAHSIATVDQLAEGRLVLGLGAGFPMEETKLEFAAADANYRRRIAQLERNVAIWRWLWSDPCAPPPSGIDDAIAHALGAMPRPARPGGPPLWLAGSGPNALDRAGRLFDGWLPYPPTAADFDTQRAAVGAAARDAGRTTPVECAVYATVVIDDRPGAAFERLDRFSRVYYGFSAETLRLMQAVVAGPPEVCADQLGQYVAAGADHLVLRLGDLQATNLLASLAGVADRVRANSTSDVPASVKEDR
jgi:alkanesulfonate monooxygenase SsuD/methylene tetrahydromethanopterin reductase-like flavin-dependent oxidoreductase (luciferase family)